MEKTDERKILLNELIASVNQCQLSFSNQKILATEKYEIVSKVCSSFENIFTHGLKLHSSVQDHIPKKSSLSKLTHLFSSEHLEHHRDFWPVIKHVLSQQEILRWEKNGGEGIGWWRGWLRGALNEHSLEQTLLRLSSKDQLLVNNYEREAFMRDVEKVVALPNLAAGLSTVIFALEINVLSLGKNYKNYVGNVSKDDELSKSEEKLSEGDTCALEKFKTFDVGRKRKKKRAKLVEIEGGDNDDSWSAMTSSSFDSDMSLGVQHCCKKNSTEVKSRETFSDSNVYIVDRKIINMLNKDFQNQNSIKDQNTISNDIKQTQLDQNGNINMISSGVNAAVPSTTCAITTAVPGIHALKKYSHRYSKSLHLFPKSSSFHPISPLALSDSGNSTSVNRQSVAKNFGKKENISTEKMSKSFDENFHCPLNTALDEETNSMLLTSNFSNEFLINPSAPKSTDTAVISSTSNNTPINNHFIQKLTLSNTPSTSSQYILDSQSKTLLNDPHGLNNKPSSQPFTIVSTHNAPITTFSDLFTTNAPFSTNYCQTNSKTITSSPLLQNIRQPVQPLKPAQLLKSHTRCYSDNYVDFKSIYEESDDEEYFDKDDDDRGDLEGMPHNTSSDCYSRQDASSESYGSFDSEHAALTEVLKEASLPAETLIELLDSNESYHPSRDEVRQALSLLLSCKNNLFSEYSQLKEQLKQSNEVVSSLRSNQQYQQTISKISEDFTVKASVECDKESQDKLNQLSEMHGDLVELNNHLLRRLVCKDQRIRSLERQMNFFKRFVPPEEIKYISQNTVSVTIPSTALRGTKHKSFHCYLVSVKVKDQEWGVERRYTDFHNLHTTYSTMFSIVDTFHFPPKKTFGKHDPKLVETRRKDLENYLRKLLPLIINTNPSLSTNLNKQALILAVPFFSPDFQVINRKSSLPQLHASNRR